MRKLLAVACIVTAVSCSSPTNGTSLLVGVSWTSGWPIVQLSFTGAQGSTVVFPPSLRPLEAGTELSSPQTVIVTINDSFDGEMITVNVQGLLADAGVFASGSGTGIIDAGQQVTVNVALTQGGATGGGTAATGGGSGSTGGGTAATGGGSAGGTGGGSGNADAGVCNCKTGCCLTGTTTCAVGAYIFPTQTSIVEYLPCPRGVQCPEPNVDAGTCGAHAFCVTQPPDDDCNTLQADVCTPSGCRCGTGPACGAGEFCYLGTCVCSVDTNCKGCCAGGTTCIADVSSTACGNSGIDCADCTMGTTGACDTSNGVCGGLTTRAHCTAGPDGGTCISGNSCLPIGFPRCAALPTDTPCLPCDFLRSDHCGDLGKCSCGDGGACGPTEACTHFNNNPLGVCGPLSSAATQ
jgi:hypothetical protein